MSNSILLVGDAPEQQSGLARILRDLATLLAASPDWRVASLGYMGIGTSRLPWQQYTMASSAQTVDRGAQVTLPHAWEDHAQGHAGIVMTIWDATRLRWLGQPESLRHQDHELMEWIDDARARKFKLWGYFPFDATGPDGRLTASVRDTLLGFDRILVPSPWTEQLVRQTIGQHDADQRGLTWLPHPIGQTFVSEVLDAGTDVGQDGSVAGSVAGRDVVDHEVLIGIVGTNQERKNWGFTAELCRAIRRTMPKVKFWWHCDTPLRHVDIGALLNDFDLTQDVTVTYPPVSDQWLVAQYRKCDLTLLPTLGEGWGYPWVESFACDVPCLHTDYAGGASAMRTCGLSDYLVPTSDQWRIEGQHNSVRPVLSVESWMTMVIKVLNEKRTSGELSARVEHLRWGNIAERFLHWFRDGIS